MKKHSTKIQIRFKDLDKLGHVNNANHLTYLETARVAFADAVFGEINWDKEGFILARVEIDYKKPIYLTDDVWVETWISRIGSKSFDMSYSIVNRKNNDVLAEATSVLVCMDYQKNITIAIPEQWKKAMANFTLV